MRVRAQISKAGNVEELRLVPVAAEENAQYWSRDAEQNVIPVGGAAFHFDNPDAHGAFTHGALYDMTLTEVPQEVPQTDVGNANK